MEKLNVAIVDDNPLILNTLDELINAEDGLSVIGKADNGADAINMIVDTTPDIVLLDLVMPKIDGISVVEKVKSRVMVADTDKGRELKGQIADLKELVAAYREGTIKERVE